MNLVKRSSEVRRTRGRVGVLGGVGVSLLLTSDLLPWAPTSSSYSVGLTGGLTQLLRRVVQDPGTIAKDGGLNVILSNKLADLLGMELLEL